MSQPAPSGVVGGLSRSGSSGGGDSPPPRDGADARATGCSSSVAATAGGSFVRPDAAPLPLLEVTIAIARGMVLGLVDALQIMSFLSYCMRSTAILADFVRCLVLNAMLLHSLRIISELLALDSTLSGPSAIGEKMHEGGSLPPPLGLFSLLWNAIFSVGWVLPIYAVTQVLGLGWWDRMYHEAMKEKQRRANSPSPASLPRDFSFVDVGASILKFVTTLAFALCTQALYGVISAVPLTWPLAALVFFVLRSLLHAFYCFDYRFADQGHVVGGVFRPLRLSAVFALFERHWPYYVGYGAPTIALQTYLESSGLPTMGVLAVYSIVFCVNVVTSVDAIPGPEAPRAPPFPVFSRLLLVLLRAPSVVSSGQNHLRATRAGRLTLLALRVLWRLRLLLLPLCVVALGALSVWKAVQWLEPHLG